MPGPWKTPLLTRASAPESAVEAPESGPHAGQIRPALLTALVGIGAGWLLLAAAFAATGVRDPRLPAYAWLVAHGSGITVGESVIGLVPLGATAVCVALVAVVARRQRAAGDLGTFVGVVAAVYGLVAAVLAAATSDDGITVSIPRAAVAGFVVGALGSAIGTGWRHRRAWPLSDDFRVILRGASRGLVAALTSSLVLVLVMLAAGRQRAGESWGLLDAGIVGGMVLAVACIVFLPTLVLWAASVLLGPGFALGTGTQVDLTGASLGVIPAFPALAAVPPPGEFASVTLVLVLVIPACGICAGMVTSRVRLGACAGALTGLVLGVAIGVSGGGIGPGRMLEAGPPPVTPLAIAVPLLAACGALGSVGARWRAGHYRGARDRTGIAPLRAGDLPSASRRPRVGIRDESPSAD